MMEPTIHLRQAKVGDIPAILEIEQECFQEDSFSREQFVYLICRSKGTFYVVVEQERMIAYVSLLFHAGTRYLLDIFDSRPSGLQRKEAGTVAHGADD